jgi:hypothetical protein
MHIGGIYMKKIFGILTILVVVLSLSACDSAYDMGYDDNNYEGEIVVMAAGDLPERKIIYDVDISFDVRDLSEASNTLKDSLASDEWFDQEVLTDSRHSYVIRVKTERLDTFINDLKEDFVLRDYSKVGTDVSIDYQDTSNQILALEAQLDRLLELYDNASLSDMIIINQQISQIEVELQTLNHTISSYDSLIEYSRVELDFYGSTVTSQSPFFNRLANGFLNGLNALIYVLDHLVIVLVTILPFAIIFGTIAGGTLLFIKKKNLKEKTKHTKSK